MKRFSKFLIMAFASLFVFANAYAQDLGEATEVYNNAATALTEGNDNDALAGFQKALSLAEAAGEAGLNWLQSVKVLSLKYWLK